MGTKNISKVNKTTLEILYCYLFIFGILAANWPILVVEKIIPVAPFRVHPCSPFIWEVQFLWSSLSNLQGKSSNEVSQNSCSHWFGQVNIFQTYWPQNASGGYIFFKITGANRGHISKDSTNTYIKVTRWSYHLISHDHRSKSSNFWPVSPYVKVLRDALGTKKERCVPTK